MRFLHTGSCDIRYGSSYGQSSSQRGGNSHGYIGQSLPLHGLSKRGGSDPKSRRDKSEKAFLKM